MKLSKMEECLYVLHSCLVSELISAGQKNVCESDSRLLAFDTLILTHFVR
jgi:hypothetical protein